MRTVEKLKKKLMELFPPAVCFNCGKKLTTGGILGIQPIYCTEKCRKLYHLKEKENET